MRPSAPAWFVYLVRCGDGSLYTGITTDVPRRLEQHQGVGGRGAKYLRGRGPLELVFEKQIGPRSMALSVERRVKRLPRELKEALILGDRPFDEIVGVACRPVRQST